MPERPRWTFLTSHGFVLLEVTRAPGATVREIAERSGLTERQTHRVLSDLVDGGYVARERVGRRNHYRVDASLPMRHPILEGHQVGELLAALRER
ncbi:MAG TPA: helix-turn-helix domain-containing protein [Gaiellaceae bacterium]|nr:helix-turn-helix domain-containing protein [Gaiellaceae bacterium]